MTFWRRWTQYRRAQRERIADVRAQQRSGGPGHPAQATPGTLGTQTTPAAPVQLQERPGPEEASGPDLLASTLPLGESGPDGATAEPDGRPSRATSNGRSRDYGRAGIPFNRQSPFYVGFVGALGVLVAYAVVQAIGRLDTTITLLIVSFFLTLSLNPLVEALTRQRMRRGWAVAIVFLGLLAVFTLIGMVVIPPVAAEATELSTRAPGMLDDLLRNRVVQDLDQRYEVIQRIQEEISKRVADGNLWAGIFGGVLDAGRIIASGVFSILTVLVLTLYFLATLPSVKQASYALVPATRRTRFISLAEEIMRRVGSYAIGQVAVAATNAFCAWIMMSLLDVPYAAVLAVAVGLLGLIPMVGATLGASVVALVAFFDEPQKALIVIIYFIVYQQLENYAVMPRIMQQTVAVPGALTVVAALAGGTLLGILGALLAIPFAAGALLIYEEVLVPRQQQH